MSPLNIFASMNRHTVTVNMQLSTHTAFAIQHYHLRIMVRLRRLILPTRDDPELIAQSGYVGVYKH